MDFAYTREQEMLRKMVREFAEKELAPRALELDAKEAFPFDIVKKIGALGLIGMTTAKQYGGSAMGHLARAIAIEEVSRVYAPLGFFLQTGLLAMYAIESFGSEEQKQKYLPALCKGDKISGFALTEQSGGSDPAAMESRAQAEGDGYVVNGRKVLISLAEVADVMGFVARTGDSFSAFLVEKGTPGYTVTRREPRPGLRTIPVNEFVLSNCKLPKANLLGQEGRGLPIAITTISVMGRTGAAAIGLGLAQGAYAALVKFVKERKLYGKPMSELQVIQFALVDMNVEIEAARWLLYYPGWLLDQGKSPREVGTEIARAKLYCVDLANRLIPKAIQFMGGYGLAPEYHVARRLNDALELPPAAGAQEVMRATITRAALA